MNDKSGKEFKPPMRCGGCKIYTVLANDKQCVGCGWKNPDFKGYFHYADIGDGV